jgi:short-subunit dehydrogenase
LKIIMTGNPNYGLAKALSQQIPGVSYHSRQCGISSDLSLEEAQNKFAELSLDYDVFINNSYISHFAQVHLARKVWTLWKQKKKSGSIINVGSTVRDLLRPDNRFYPISKRALEDYSRQLYLHSIWGDSKIRVACINFGGIATQGTLKKWPHFHHMDVEYCAKILTWVLTVPEGVNLDLLQVSPIQPKSKREMKRQENQSSSNSPSDYLIADFDETHL